VPSFALRGIALCLPAILGWLPLTAQTSSYHLVSDDRATGSSKVTLVNDSEKAIDAYGAFQRCRSRRKIGASNWSYDSKDILQGFINVHGARGGRPPRTGMIEPGGRWDTSLFVSPPNGVCDSQIGAVLFTDGSFEGTDTAVRALKAQRDGMAASVNYWADRISRENPDGSTLGSFLDEIRRRVRDDQTKQHRYRIGTGDVPPPLWDYWAGRLYVDQNIDQGLPRNLSEEKASQNFHRVADEINAWKKKIDSNVAMRKLNLLFPPISDPAETGDRAEQP
jgi:hypothetical protein